MFFQPSSHQTNRLLFWFIVRAPYTTASLLRAVVGYSSAPDFVRRRIHPFQALRWYVCAVCISCITKSLSAVHTSRSRTHRSRNGSENALDSQLYKLKSSAWPFTENSISWLAIPNGWLFLNLSRGVWNVYINQVIECSVFTVFK